MPARAGRKKSARRMPEASATLLEKVVDFYHDCLAAGGKGMEYLKRLALSDSALLDAARVGYCDGSLLNVLPAKGAVRQDLRSHGVLDDSDEERLLRCLVFPLADEQGGILGLCGIRIQDGGGVELPATPTSLWNMAAAGRSPDIFLARGVIDGLSLQAAGLPNVAALVGRVLQEQDVEALQGLGLKKVTLVAFSDPDPDLLARLRPFQPTLKTLPDGLSVNETLVRYGPDELATFVHEAREEKPPAAAVRPRPAPSAQPAAPAADLTIACGPRRYELRGLEKSGRKLKATLRIEHGGRLHVDTLDFYSARARRALAQDLCRLFDQSPEIVESDLARIVKHAENWRPTPGVGETAGDAPIALSAEERAEAEAFGRDPRLIDRILQDFELCGLVGEEANKLLCYLAAVSRKMDDPLSVLILSSSGAGKTALQDAALMLCPPEDMVRLTSLTGKALFYKGRKSLKHKLLALEEGAGAQEASYAIRNLISAKQLIIETTVKDLGTGRLTTVENRVEGPTAVFITTTDPDVDPETRSRFFVTSVDESRAQTRAILQSQRRRHTLAGQARQTEIESILRRHHNFQRLLRPLLVVNPHAENLVYADDRLQSRRDQPKYLNLIRAVAFLRQMTKELKGEGQTPKPYVEVDAEDIGVATELGMRLLGRNGEDLNGVSRELLALLDKMVEERLDRLRQEDGGNLPAPAEVRFTRRDIREYSGWAHARVQRYVRQLVELEYVLVEAGKNGRRYVYRLACHGQGRAAEQTVAGLALGETE